MLEEKKEEVKLENVETVEEVQKKKEEEVRVKVRAEIQRIWEIASQWPDGKLRTKVAAHLKLGHFRNAADMLKQPPGSEVIMRDGTCYLVDRNGTYIRRDKKR